VHQFAEVSCCLRERESDSPSRGQLRATCADIGPKHHHRRLLSLRRWQHSYEGAEPHGGVDRASRACGRGVLSPHVGVWHVSPRCCTQEAGSVHANMSSPWRNRQTDRLTSFSLESTPPPRRRRRRHPPPLQRWQQQQHNTPPPTSASSPAPSPDPCTQSVSTRGSPTRRASTIDELAT
jgi:hypothetical protein